MSKAVIIGSGFSGLSSAIHLAHHGWEVEVLEKHSIPGGRARYFESDGFRFEMGPSWYWMPDIFERFFEDYGENRSDYYSLKRLDPSYRVYFDGDQMDIPASMNQLEELFESYEVGAAVQLRKFLNGAKRKYDLGIHDLVRKPGLSIAELMDVRVLLGSMEMDVFKSMRKHVYKYFKHPSLRLLLEFPVLFLGAPAQRTPALYSLMNYADMALGTWYPEGGMYAVVEGMYQLALKKGVSFKFNADVTGLRIENNEVKEVMTAKESYHADAVISSADYHFTEEHILGTKWRNYSEEYWDNRKMSPSVLLYFLGIDKKLPELEHHNLFFDKDIDAHSEVIYDRKEWPEEPLFYACMPSKTDNSLAPEGHENLFLLIPLAPDLEDSEEKREMEFVKMMDRIEQKIGYQISEHVVYKRSYAMSNLKEDYGAYKGNAYGLANTLLQTANLKPRIKNKKLNNFYYTGQLTVPGPGVPPSLISGQVVSDQLIKEHKLHYERAV